ncbi:DUF3304 domain-containing protein [Lysobacter sp. A378]
MKTFGGKLWLAFVTLLLVVPMLGGCREKNETVMLGIVGYNYTDRYIDRFSVGGAGGSNVFLSDHDSGGGKTACCIGYNPDRPLPITMDVEWMFGYQRGPSGQVTVPDEYHETTAVLDGPVPEDPYNLEVHFMPDGTVQLLITAEHSKPLLQIDRSGASRASLGRPATFLEQHPHE